MSDWTAGYVADIGYTFGYYNELNPLRIKLAFLNAGLVCPEIGTACELGFGQVDTAYSLASGLLAVRDARPSIALLDINLTDGISLRVAEVLAGSHIPSVFMSGDPGAEKEHGLVKGTLLIKPFSPAQLQDALMKVLAP